jgi:hypothetical protein
MFGIETFKDSEGYLIINIDQLIFSLKNVRVRLLVEERLIGILW